MKSIPVLYIVFLILAMSGPLFYCSNFSIFCSLQFGGLLGAGIIWFVQIFKKRGRTRLIWLSSVLIFPIMYLVTNPIFIGISCKNYISDNENELNAINTIVLKSKVLISVRDSYCAAPADFPDATKEELRELCTNLKLDVSGDEQYVMFLFKSGEVAGFGALLFYGPDEDEIDLFGLNHVIGDWYYQ